MTGPQEVVRASIAAQVCPFCGRGPFAMLPVHTNKMHGVDKWELRELAGFSTSDPLCSEEVRAKMSAAYDPARGEQARAAGRRPRRAQRWTSAGLARNTETIRSWMQEHPEEHAEAVRKAAVAAGAGDVRRRQAEALRKWHERNPMSAEERARQASYLQSVAAREAHAVAMAARRQGCGTSASYKRGCRCEACRAAKAAYRKRSERSGGVES